MWGSKRRGQGDCSLNFPGRAPSFSLRVLSSRCAATGSSPPPAGITVRRGLKLYACRYVCRFLFADPAAEAFRRHAPLRHRYVESLLLAFQLLPGGGILALALHPSWSDVGKLASTRTALNYFLEKNCGRSKAGAMQRLVKQVYQHQQDQQHKEKLEQVTQGVAGEELVHSGLVFRGMSKIPSGKPRRVRVVVERRLLPGEAVPPFGQRKPAPTGPPARYREPISDPYRRPYSLIPTALR